MYKVVSAEYYDDNYRYALIYKNDVVSEEIAVSHFEEELKRIAKFLNEFHQRFLGE